MSISIQNAFRLFLWVLLLNAAGLLLELYFIEHFDNTKQWIPLVVLLIAFSVFILDFSFKGSVLKRVMLASMTILVITGILGIYFHLEENFEFAQEMYPTASFSKLLSETFHGATPALAPGSVTGLGLMGMIYILIKEKSQ